MSQVTINRIAAQLHSQFDGKIDMSDWASRPAKDRDGAFLSRALAALAIKTLANVDAEVAASTVTDGFDDDGIDALYLDQTTDIFYIVQSKWSHDGSTPINVAKINSFALGSRRLLTGTLDGLNEKIQSKTAEIRTALISDSVRLRFITIDTATQSPAPFVRKSLDEYITQLNDPVLIADAKYFGQEGVYGLITAESTPPEITLQGTSKYSCPQL